MDSSEILKSGKKVILLEQQALLQLHNCLGQSFVDTAQLIYSSKGRIIVTGIGKSALIAQKMVATFNSTGTPAIFMHAGDAIHGDLGMIQKDDIVIAISKSGETAEIKAMVPFLRHFGNKITGITCNEFSYLAKNADLHILVPVAREAEPNNLAPTSSTTATMALGDALATVLLELRGFSPDDFARYHPGGILGKRLYLTAGDLAAGHLKPEVSLNAGIREIIVSISAGRLGMTAVCSNTGEILGIITDGDIRRLFEKQSAISDLKAENIMTPEPACIDYAEPASRAMEVMQQRSINQIIVLKDNLYLGVIHIQDIVREGVF